MGGGCVAITLGLPWSGPFGDVVGTGDTSHRRCGESTGHGDQFYTWDFTDLLCELRKPPNLSVHFSLPEKDFLICPN